MAQQNKISRQAHERAGRRAEWLAEILLRLKGYRILSRRFRSGRGEIDLVARRGPLITFIEVKARASREVAISALTTTSERRISDAAIIFLSRHPKLAPEEVRYDLITVTRWIPQHHKDVFRPEGRTSDPAGLF